MLRVLVTVSPRMYREAIALAVHRGRPGLDVRVAPPEAAGTELGGFRPHLLVHNESPEIAAEALSGVPCRVEVLYSDGMDARVHADGRAAEGVSDMSTERLLGVVDAAAELAGLAERGVERGRAERGVERGRAEDA